MAPPAEPRASVAPGTAQRLLLPSRPSTILPVEAASTNRPSPRRGGTFFCCTAFMIATGRLSSRPIPTSGDRVHRGALASQWLRVASCGTPIALDRSRAPSAPCERRARRAGKSLPRRDTTVSWPVPLAAGAANNTSPSALGCAQEESHASDNPRCRGQVAGQHQRSYTATLWPRE